MNKYSIDDYKQALNSRAPEQIDATQNTEDYYNALKNESYKSLLNSEVQASIARDQALKYTNNSLRANGYANQGLAESTGLGIQSQYSNALANAANNYRNSIQDINTQQRTEQLNTQRDNFESVTSLMSGAMNQDELQNVLTTYGYMDDKGNWKDDSLSSLDENSQKQLQILYNMYNSQLADSPSSTMTSLDALNAGTYQGNDTKIKTLGDHYSEEMKLLWHKGSNGEFDKGESFVVKNGNGDTVYMQWVGNGFRIVNEEKYNASSKKHELTWNNASKQLSYK